MINEIIPFIRVGKLFWGMSRIETREALNSQYRVFTRNKFSENTMDFYFDLNMFLIFDKKDILQAVEFSSPNNVIFNGINLFGFDFENLVDYFCVTSKRYELEDDVSIIFYDLGFSAFKLNDVQKIESVLAFSDKYYD